MRVLVLVGSSLREPWRTIELHGQRTTWAATARADVPVLFYYGASSPLRPYPSGLIAYGLRKLRAARVRERFLHFLGRRYVRRPVRRDGSRIWTGVPDNLVNMSARLRVALRHVLATEEFDFVLMSNVSTYVHLENLRRFASTICRSGYYGGFLGEDPEGVPFASGMGALMSRDFAEAAAYHDAWEYVAGDDVALGRLARHLGVRPEFIPRVEVSHPDQPLDLEALDRCFLIRCKSATSRSLDVETMQKVHAVYLSRASRIA